MLNIGPVYVWDIIFFSIIIFGGLIGFALGMMGSIYFLIGMIVSLALMFALESSLIGTWNKVGHKIFDKLLTFKDSKLEVAVVKFVSENVGILLYRCVWIGSSLSLLFILYFAIIRSLVKLFNIKGWVTRGIGFIINAIPWTFLACFLITFTSINFLYTNNTNSEKVNKIKDESVGYKIGRKITPQLKLITNINTLHIWYSKLSKSNEEIVKDFKETLLDQEKFKESIGNVVELAKDNPEIGDVFLTTVKNTIHLKPVEDSKKADINKLIKDYNQGKDEYYEKAKNDSAVKSQLKELGVDLDGAKPEEGKQKIKNLVTNLESLKSQVKENQKLTGGLNDILKDFFKGTDVFFNN